MTDYSQIPGGEDMEIERILSEDREEKKNEKNGAPYPWCRQPDICVKKGYCQRDPNCGE